MITIIPATSEMVKARCKGVKSVRAIAAIEDEKVLGVAGVYLDGDKQIVFASLCQELKDRPKAILMAWKELKKTFRPNLPVFAFCDFTLPRTENFLLHFGFLPYKDNIWRAE